MYVYIAYKADNPMSIYYALFIQGEELIKAAERGDVVVIERLLNEIPNLINFKNSVRV